MLFFLIYFLQGVPGRIICTDAAVCTGVQQVPDKTVFNTPDILCIAAAAFWGPAEINIDNIISVSVGTGCIMF